jgi:hypothetical protein
MAYTTINKSSDYFNGTAYTGNGTAGRDITLATFQPDFTWIKSRSDSDNHRLVDAVRTATKHLSSDLTAAEETSSNVTAFTSDGVTLSSNGAVNANSETYISWNWLANGTGSANTDGSISSTVSVNTTSGFSIVKFTGTGANGTVGHGLGVAPKVIIQKGLDASLNWKMYHSSLGAGAYINFDEAAGSASSTVTWNNTAPTSSLFSVGSGNNNNSSQDYIAYCFAEKPGYSKIGSYTGNGNIDGPFAYTGFKPNFIMLKNTVDNGDNWTIYDSSRDPNNKSENLLFANSNSTEADGNFMDILSNGFKQRNTSNGNNGSGDKLIYMAFGQSIVGSNNVPATAR